MESRFIFIFAAKYFDDSTARTDILVGERQHRVLSFSRREKTVEMIVLPRGIPSGCFQVEEVGRFGTDQRFGQRPSKIVFIARFYQRETFCNSKSTTSVLYCIIIFMTNENIKICKKYFFIISQISAIA